MAKVIIEFIDADDGTVDLMFHSSDQMELDSPPEDLTNAQDMAVMALHLLTEHLKKNDCDLVDIENLNPDRLN
jgi:hypothetical protein